MLAHDLARELLEGPNLPVCLAWPSGKNDPADVLDGFVFWALCSDEVRYGYREYGVVGLGEKGARGEVVVLGQELDLELDLEKV
jgi:hypothetical protein